MLPLMAYCLSIFGLATLDLAVRPYPTRPSRTYFFAARKALSLSESLGLHTLDSLSASLNLCRYLDLCLCHGRPGCRWLRACVVPSISVFISMARISGRTAPQHCTDACSGLTLSTKTANGACSLDAHDRDPSFDDSGRNTRGLPELWPRPGVRTVPCSSGRFSRIHRTYLAPLSRDRRQFQTLRPPRASTIVRSRSTGTSSSLRVPCRRASRLPHRHRAER